MTTFQIIFNVVLPLGLLLIMLGMGLGLEPGDFLSLLKHPGAALVGVFGQLVMLPVLAFLLSSMLDLPSHVAVGVIILAACPGGVTSNAMVFFARGDTTLSVSLTALNSVVTVFTIPFIVGLGLSHFMGEGGELALDPVQTILRLGTIAILPVALGMIIRRFARGFARRAEPVFKRLSLLLLLFMMAAVLLSQYDYLLANLAATWRVVFLLNFSCMGGAWLLCNLARIDLRRTATLIVEIGLQNGNLAILVATTLLMDARLAIVPTIYGTLSPFSALLVILWLARRFERPADSRSATL